MALDDQVVKELNAAIDAATIKSVDATGEQVGDNVSSAASTLAPADASDKVEEKVIGGDHVGEVTEEIADESAVSLEADQAVEAIVPEKPTVSDLALTRAVRAGMSLGDAMSFSDEATLVRITESLEAGRKPAEQGVSNAEDDSDTDLLASLPKLDPDVYEADVIKMYDGLVEVIRKQQDALKSLQSNQEQTSRVNQEAVARDVEKWFDGKVAGLGEDFVDSLGAGSYDSLDRGGLQYAKRDAIANQVAVLLAGYRASGQQPPPRDDVFDVAARLVLRGEFQKVTEKNLSLKLSQRASQHINRAGGQKGKETKSASEAVASMLDEKFFAKS